MTQTTRRALLIAAPAAALAGGAWWLTRPEAAPPLAAFAQDAAPAGPVDTSAIQEMTLGAEDAPVTLIEYASFTCPHCRRFHEEVLPGIKADYVDTGRVRFVYREVYFDRPGLWAGMVARCGGGMRYFGIADMIYDEQSEWTQGAPAEVAESLKRIGVKAGLEAEQVDACLSDGEAAQALVSLWERRAEEDGINSTPSFILDGAKLPNMSEAELRAALDRALAG